MDMHLSTKYRENLVRIQSAVPSLEQLQNASVLITGGGGLICAAIADFFLSLNDHAQLNISICVADIQLERLQKRFAGYGNRNDLHLLQYNVTESLNVDEHYDYIIHGASNASPAAFVEQPVEVMTSNFIGMKNLLDYAKANQTRKMLYISSSEVYGQKKDANPYSEYCYYSVDILNPRACYPSAKRAAETLCVSYYEEYGVQTVIARPGHIYGFAPNPKDNRAASEFARNAAAGQDIIMKSAGTQLRSYCYVLDCVSAIVAILLNGQPGEAYNISNRNAIVSIRELAECIADCCGVKVRFESSSDIEKASYNLMDNSALTSDKLEALGWSGFFTLKEGILLMLETMRDSVVD